jgi:hypothetical protein
MSSLRKPDRRKGEAGITAKAVTVVETVAVMKAVTTIDLRTMIINSIFLGEVLFKPPAPR